MKSVAQGITAHLVSPDQDNAGVQGTVFVSRFGARFQSESCSEDIPASRLEVEWTDGAELVCFRDSGRPGLRITTTDPRLFEVPPSLPQLKDAFEAATEARSRRAFKRALRCTIYTLVGCIIVACLCSWATSAMVLSLANRVPPEWESDVGEAALESFSTIQPTAHRSNQVAQLTAMAAPLLRVAPTNRMEPKFYIVDDPEPNAAALPGGYVVVNTGLLDLATEPEELMAVLAHEWAHVVRKHHARQIIAASGPFIICGVFLQSDSGLLNVLGGGAGLMIYNGFSKEYEIEADDSAWDYLVAAKIDPRGMINMFRKFQEYERREKVKFVTPKAFKSHPELNKRIARLESRWKKLSRKEGFIQITNTLQTAPR